MLIQFHFELKDIAEVGARANQKNWNSLVLGWTSKLKRLVSKFYFFYKSSLRNYFARRYCDCRSYQFEDHTISISTRGGFPILEFMVR